MKNRFFVGLITVLVIGAILYMVLIANWTLHKELSNVISNNIVSIELCPIENELLSKKCLLPNNRGEILASLKSARFGFPPGHQAAKSRWLLSIVLMDVKNSTKKQCFVLSYYEQPESLFFISEIKGTNSCNGDFKYGTGSLMIDSFVM